MAKAGKEDWLGELRSSTKPKYRELAFMSLFVNLLALAVPIFVLQVYDRVVFLSGLTTLQALVIGVTLAIFFDFVLRQARSSILQRVSIRLDAELGRRLFQKLTALPLRTLERQTTAEWQTLHRDTELVRNTLGGPPALLAVDLPFVALFLGLIAIIATPLLWVLAVAVPLFLIVALWSSRSLMKASDAEQSSSLRRDALVTELIAGRTTAKALSIGPNARDRWEELHGSSMETSLQRGRRMDRFANMGVAVAMLTTVALTSVGALAILEQQLTVGALIAANMLANRVTAPLNQLVNTWRTWSAYRRAKERLSELFAMADDRKNGSIGPARPNGRLSVENLVFRYEPDGEPAIDNLTFKLGPGSLHGIVGRSGCGKTTLLKLLQGLYAPDSGRVLLDGADIEQFTSERLAEWFGYVPQDTYLTAGTIRDNISGGRASVSDEDILRAATLAGAHDFIADLHAGYDTEVGEGGGKLSGGQRQRVTIARGLIGDPPVLLMDEPTSNLDRPTEEYLRNTLVELAKTRNVVVITHAPVLLSACGNIMVMKRGRIVEAGKGPEVLSKLFAGQGAKPPLERMG